MRPRFSKASLAGQPWPVDALALPGWDGTVAGAVALQAALAARLVLADEVREPLRVIAGVDVGFEDDGRTTRAAAVLLDADSLQPVAEVVARRATTMPYVPGLLSFRELPAVLEALAALPQSPDLIICDGQGVAHPRRLGIAAHIGIATGLPSLGVAKTRLVGVHEPVGLGRGDRAVLRDARNDEAIGWVLRSKDGCNPLFVSPGHRVSMASAPERVLRYTTRYRLPEPTRLADRLASRSGPPAGYAPPVPALRSHD